MKTDHNRLRKQIQFILEIDRLKKIVRQTLLTDRSRKENDAEHSWHIALMAVLLLEHAEGGTWKEHRVNKDQVVKRNHPIAFGSTTLWEFAEGLINDAADKRYLEDAGWREHGPEEEEAL
jgi:hypothetical protein